MENIQLAPIPFKERVIVALDTSNMRSAKKWVQALKGSIKIFKIGSELFTAYGPKAVQMVREAGAEVFLDLKFHDIPNTVAHAARAAVRLEAFMFNVHVAGGLQMMQEACVAAADEAQKRSLRAPKLIGVTVLTSLSQQDLNQEIGIPGAVDDTVLRYAEFARKAGLDGIVASAMEVGKIRSKIGASFLLVTPGIRPSWFEKQDQSRVVNPRQAFESGSDYIVIGRPITEAKDPVEAAERIFQELS